MNLTRWTGLAAASCLALTAFSVPAEAVADPLKGYRFLYSEADRQTHVYDPRHRQVAELTAGARSVLVHGAKRTFKEPTTRAKVTTDAWVRKLRDPYAGGRFRQAPFRRELAGLLKARSDDLLAISMQYIVGAKPKKDAQGRVYRGDAHYGPLVDGQRQEGSDFNDYLGVAWKYYDGSVDKPEKKQVGSLDCSGFVRMVLGYRMGWPLENQQHTRKRIPRRATEIERYAPGRVIIPNTGARPANLSQLQAGDLLFWNADPLDGPAIDHVGIFLGRDSLGDYRFISSRKSVDGPTMGDVRGPSVLNRKGKLYSDSFRAAKRA